MKKILAKLLLIVLLFFGAVGCEFINNIPESGDIDSPIIEEGENDYQDEDELIDEETNEDIVDIIDEEDNLDIIEEEDENTEENTEEEQDEIIDKETLEDEDESDNSPLIDKDGVFTSRDEVALYIYVYGKLPKNYMTKAELKGKNISYYYTDENKMSVGGDIFYNREGLLPYKAGRTYYEADINYRGQSSRGKERIVFSDDGLIFYTSDHYGSFVKYDPEDGKWKSY